MSELTSNIKITESAQDYLAELLAKQEVEGIGVRIFVEYPGTPRAECCMSYCQPDEVDEDDLQIAYAKFTAHIDTPSIPYLHDAVIDYNKDRFGGQLTFRAPNSKVPQVGENASIEERINYVLQAEINPSLASHGGSVELIEVIEDEAGLTAVLKFGGGCQGCSAVDVTLRQGVEVQLKQQIPELTQVVDDTDHSISDNAYYR
ncbi:MULTISPECIES: Fe-S biogenesis protein NfuA [Moraxella]|uniref:Fe/S biogenesis protein NfuA n=1 Tax=Moraxella nasicaprae TaxID=2904122 RepID=A0ABY6F6D3_9GAMM|nr:MULTISPECIES: Fe-S biogenesis protein NfuA [Moraxella]MDO4894631.1 Fe-S biogenesis protein NfuA [Moraxella sp.]UXZ05661.1 Fe-S biogenesis protein NfuA [Moraxella nasicaprae]